MAACCLLALTGAQPSLADAPCFGLAQWQALQHASHAPQEGALLYVWSPRMVLSARYADEVARTAQAAGLAFIPVHDGRLSATEVQQALHQLAQAGMRQTSPASDADDPLTAAVATGRASVLAGSQPLCLPELEAQDAYRHFPTAWVVRRGSYHPRPLVAAMPASYWQEGIRQRLLPAAGQPERIAPSR